MSSSINPVASDLFILGLRIKDLPHFSKYFIYFCLKFGKLCIKLNFFGFFDVFYQPAVASSPVCAKAFFFSSLTSGGTSTL
jgi:hypothetical protein